MPTVSCGRCRAILRNRYDQVEVRTELRSVATLRRLRTWRTELVCRSCADGIAREHDHPGAMAPCEQEVLPW